MPENREASVLAAAGQSGPGRGQTSKLGVYDAEESESAPNLEYSTDEGAEPGKAKPTLGGSGGKGRSQGEQERILHGSDSERNVRVTEVNSCAPAGPGKSGVLADAISKVRAVCGSAARTDLCGGRSAMIVPTAPFYFFYFLTSIPVPLISGRNCAKQ